MREPVYLALGTNLGDRQSNLRTARQALLPEVYVIRVSPVYITSPWGYADQPDFLNQVMEVRTELGPLPLLRYLKAIESQMGRVDNFRNGPRVIDLDILFYGDRVIDQVDLQIPHPRLQERAFVLVPLNDIAPNYVHPILKKTIRELLPEVDTTGVKPL